VSGRASRTAAPQGRIAVCDGNAACSLLNGSTTSTAMVERVSWGTQCSGERKSWSPMKIENRLATIGRCIYCGSTDPPLTKEHIIPQGLKGREFLHQASCENCRRKTQAFEQDVLREMMRPLRIQYGLRGIKRKNSPDSIQVTAIAPEGDYKLDLPPNEIPIAAVFPIFPEARFFTRVPRDENIHVKAVLKVPLHILKGEGKWPGLGSHGFQQNVPIGSFVRMLAKIAHCRAVAVYGLDAFEPFLCEIIRDSHSNWGEFIGCLSNETALTDKDEKYSDKIGIAQVNGEPIIVTNIRLFKPFGAPDYHVVTGRRVAAPKT
jgi:hypothetical protein